MSHIDKFPRLVDYVVPAGVRIGDGDRLRLGAHLASGTTVMHEGFVNFTPVPWAPPWLRVVFAQGVVVGDGSDVGGGASTMGTLSGGGTQRVSIGERSLLGAESGIGIALGDDCVVEAGLYVSRRFARECSAARSGGACGEGCGAVRRVESAVPP